MPDPGRVEINGVNLHYETRGEGPDLLLVHGFGMTSRCWCNIVDRFPSRRVTTVDLKGSGGSDKPRDRLYSVLDQAELVLGFIRRMDLSDLVLLGHSFGGAVSLQVSARLLSEDPGRLKGLGLLASAGLPQPMPYFLSLLSVPVLGEIIVHLEPMTAGIWTGMRGAYFHKRAATWAAARDCARSIRSPGGRQALLATARLMRALDVERVTSVYRSIDVPSQLIWGRQDCVVPLAVGEGLHELLPNSTLDVLDRCGHCPQDEYPERTAELISRLF